MRRYYGVILDRNNTAILPQYHRNITAILPHLTHRLIKGHPSWNEIYRMGKNLSLDFLFEIEKVQIKKRKGQCMEFKHQVKERTLPNQNQFKTIDGSIKPGNSKEQAAVSWVKYICKS